MREVASEGNITTPFLSEAIEKRPTPRGRHRETREHKPIGSLEGAKREGRRLSPDLGLSGPVKTMV